MSNPCPPEQANVANLALNQASVGYDQYIQMRGDDEKGPDHGWTLVDTVGADTTSLTVSKLDPLAEYTFAVRTVVKNADGDIEYSQRSEPSTVVVAEAAPLNLTRAPLFVILALLCGVVLAFILWARSGR